MNKKSVEKDKEFFLILLAQGASASEEGVCLIGEYLLFLTKYSFLLTDKPQENIFFKRDFSSPGDISTQNPNGARYLDPKYSRWLSTDPALSSYVERNYNGTSGGIYNSVNLNLYHYGGNNPIKYVDQDGREDVYSHKCGENLYSFSADTSTIDGGIKSLYGLIPFVGGAIYDGINWILGYKRIDESDAYSKLVSIASPVLDTLGNLDKITSIITKIANFTGSVPKAISSVSKVFGYIGYTIVAGDVIYQLTRREEVAVNNLIDMCLRGSLISNSHENVAALYFYAKNRMIDLIENGKVEYESSWDGTLKTFCIDINEIDSLKEELKVLNQLLKEE